MGEVLELAEALWNGQKETTTHHPIGPPYGMEKIAPSTWFHKFFSNTVIRETSDGLVIIDPSAFMGAQAKYEAVRSVTSLRAHTIIFTHGHVDHCFGIEHYFQEAKEKGWPMPQVLAHEAMEERFRRYKETVGYNSIINSRQFQAGRRKVQFPSMYPSIDIHYRDHMKIWVGEVEVSLRHARGETDDHTWVFFPDTGVLCPGDLIFWCVPNAGNPQKVQRYAREWAMALREMAALEAEVLAPGHGWPVIGKDRVRQVLEDNARILEIIHEQTVELMNRGATLDEVVHGIHVPEQLLSKPYLRPVYDEPEFIARNVWRLYGGWYDGIPSHLKPAPERAQAEEIARLAGGAEKLAMRAQDLAGQGDLRLACHLADWAYMASSDDPGIREVRARIYEQRAKSETSTMAKGIFMDTAREMRGEPPIEETGRPLVIEEQQKQRK